MRCFDLERCFDLDEAGFIVIDERLRLPFDTQPTRIMADRDVELDSLLPRFSSPTTSEHGRQPAASLGQTLTPSQDVRISDLPPLPRSAPSSSYRREQVVSTPPSLRAPSSSTHPITPEPPAKAPLVDLIGNKLQSMIGLLQETVDVLGQAAATGQISDTDAASLQEVVVGEGRRSQEKFVLEKVEVMSEEEIAAYDESWSCGWKSKSLLSNGAF